MALTWPPSLGRNHKLGVRLVSVSLAGLVFGLAMVLGTLWLSWALEGAAAAINDTGSLRMQSVRLGLTLSQLRDQSAPELEVISRQKQALDQTLANLREGDPQRPLRMPGSHGVQEQFARVTMLWNTTLSPALLAVTSGETSRAQAVSLYLQELPQFVEQTDQLVSRIESENSRTTTYLRGSQLALIVLMLAGSVAIIYLLYGWVIRPVQALQAGIVQMTARNFSVQVPVGGHDEFGELASGFNDMAAQLKTLYADLEERVSQKTLQLAQQNRALSTLYDFSSYLSQPGELEQRCAGFLKKLVEYFGADGGTVRILDPRQNNLHLTVHQGVSPNFVQEEQCVHTGDCLCGEAAALGETQLHDFRKLPIDQRYLCREEGFNSIAIAQITNGAATLGSYTLHFAEPREFSGDDRRLFDSVGQHLGVAIENQRLLARTRELAVAQERNLVAQGLHDSIAQGLNFLKLQVQMLEDSMKRQDATEVTESMQMIKTGLRESYDDVRELLLNFRVKLEAGDLKQALHHAAERFTRQTMIPVSIQTVGQGAPLPAEQQLQLLFIVQEALSNIRKHARAKEVKIIVTNAQDFELSVQDDGCGFDLSAPGVQPEQHVGLTIMKERAVRLGAHFAVASDVTGTRVTLRLAHQERVAA
ncbi:MAG: type IV pili methyl-accepting chemotaxis transducer N-terminal domain-containing protein [Zwartia sp.]